MRSSVKTKPPANPRIKNRKADWKFWQLRCWSLFLLKKHGKYVTIRCMCGCGAWRDLNEDHVIPLSNFKIKDPWDPCNGQILDWKLNVLDKGSSHGPKWDFRSEEYKEFQIWLRDKDWTWNQFDKWVMNKSLKKATELGLF